MLKQLDEVPVVFRIWRKEGDVIALFPTIPDVGGFCVSYQRIGQHGGADYCGVVGSTRLAKPEEYASLKRELERIGYILKVVSRRP